MRNEKGTRTCRCCFTKFNKYELEKDIIQIAYDSEKQGYIFKKISKEFPQKEYMQTKGKTMYICCQEKCINITIKANKIGKFFKKSLSEQEIETLKQMCN